MRAIADDLWVVEGPQKFLIAEIGSRMTIVRLSDGNLWVHSPVQISDETADEIRALGPVRHIVAPNKVHHLQILPFAGRFPEAKLYVAPGLKKKRPDLDGATELSDEALWPEDMDQLFFEGYPSANEIDFFHRRSRTLITTDIVVNVGPEAPWLTRLAFRLLGRYDDFGPSLLEKIFITDRAAARRSLERLLAWEFDRVTLTHGQILEQGGREAMRRGFAWLLDT